MKNKRKKNEDLNKLKRNKDFKESSINKHALFVEDSTLLIIFLYLLVALISIAHFVFTQWLKLILIINTSSM